MRHLAVTVSGPEQVELLETTVPDTPLDSHQVEGQTLASLVSAGTELASVYLPGKQGAVPGYAAVLRVTGVGGEVESVRPGDIVFCMGGHRSHLRLHELQCLPVPTALTPEAACFARMMGVTMTTLVTTTARPPSLVLVTGLGLVGHLAAQMFQACGYRVIACDPEESRRIIAQEAGMENVLPSAPVEDDTVRGHVSLALECSGHEQALLDCTNLIRKRGEVVCVATPWKQFTDLPLHALHHAIFHNYAVVRSGWEWELPRLPSDFIEGSIRGNLAGALRWLAEGRVRVQDLFTLYPPADCQRAYQDLLHKRTERLAVVFDWRQL